MSGIREDQVYLPKEVAVALRVSAVTVSRAIRSGRLKAFRVGGQWRIWGSEVTRYIESETARALAEEPEFEPLTARSNHRFPSSK